MSLNITLTETKTIVKRPEESQSLSGDIQINRIVDMPGDRKVNVFVEGIGRIELDELSGDNYDNPAQWTNADVQTAVLNWINSNLSS